MMKKVEKILKKTKKLPDLSLSVKHHPLVDVAQSLKGLTLR